MPDEYLYTAIARSIAQGGPPTVRGGRLDFIPVLASVAVSPAWLIHNVGIAYRVAQSEGVIAMALAAWPAFRLSRRLGLSGTAAATAAVFATLVPDVAFGGLLLSEPFAYPLFLLTVLLALESLRAPSARRQLLFLFAAGALCLTRLQFCFVPLVYLAAATSVIRPLRVSRVLRVHWLVVTASILALGVVAIVGTRPVAGHYGGLATFGRQPTAVAHWAASNLVLLLLAAGWVTAPGAILGLANQLRSREPAARAFATMTILVAAGLVGEAGLFGATLGQLEERYTFYAAPLLVIAWLLAFERGMLRRRVHAVLACGLSVIAFLLPLDEPLFTGIRGQSPVMTAFGVIQRHAQWRAPLLAGVLLLVLALGVLELGRRSSGRPVIVLAAALVVAIGVGYSLVLVPRSEGQARAEWDAGVGSSHASLLAFHENTVPYALTTALFWNPNIGRVLVVDGKTVDGFASVPVRLGPGGRLIRSDGRPIEGTVVFQRRVESIRTRDASITERGPWGLISNASRARVSEMVIGWSRATGTFAPNGQIAAAAAGSHATVRLTVRLWLRSPDSEITRLRFECSNGLVRTVSVGSRPRRIGLPLVGRGVASCRFAMVSGRLRWHDGYAETVQARVELAAGYPTTGSGRGQRPTA